MLIALRYYFDLVCPYSYTMGFEVEEAEDEGVVEIGWLPFELRPAPAPLPDPRVEYIKDHWHEQVYWLALEHGVGIHVPRYQPRSTCALTLHLFAVGEGKGRAHRGAAHRASFVQSSTCRTRACCARPPRRPGSTPTQRWRRRGTLPGIPACAPSARRRCVSGTRGVDGHDQDGSALLRGHRARPPARHSGRVEGRRPGLRAIPATSILKRACRCVREGVGDHGRRPRRRVWERRAPSDPRSGG